MFRSARMKIQYIVILALVLAATTGSYYFYKNLSLVPIVELRIMSSANKTFQFEIQARGVQAIGGVYIWSESKNEKLWSVSFTPTCLPPPQEIKYGIIPAGAKQFLPKENVPPRWFFPGEQLVVEIQYDYDSLFPPAASSGHWYFLFEVDQEQQVKFVRKTNFVSNQPK